MSKIMVTGAGGYIGSQLVQDLVAKGHSVTAVDRFFFGREPLKEFWNNQNVFMLQKDIRDLNEKDFQNHDAVCDLACLSNDPAGEINPELTYQINRDGRIHVAEVAKKSGIKKYIISSSCSVYGTGGEQFLNEESKTNPISVYAKSTLEAEQHNLSLSDNNFSVTALRNATVFGLSKRMRFDLVVNLMTLSAFEKSRIIVMGGGKQWRPLVHVSDVSRAFNLVLDSDNSKTNSEVFNVGLNNFQIRDLAYLVKDQFPKNVEIEIAPDDEDKRDYNVDFTKISNSIGFKASVSVEQGIKEIYKALDSNSVDTSLKTVTVKWYKHIIETKKFLSEIELNGRLL